MSEEKIDTTEKQPEENPDAGEKKPVEEIKEEPIPDPKKVEYCNLCHFPLEYCEYTHPVLLKKITTENEDEKEETKEKEKPEEEKKEAEETKEGGKESKSKKKKEKNKKEAPSAIIIEQSKRGKKKHTTYVTNLDKYGLVLKDVAKQFSKKFACSCNVTKEEDGTECITLTGEFADDVNEYITSNYPNIKPENIQMKISKK